MAEQLRPPQTMFHKLLNLKWCRVTELVAENEKSVEVFEYPNEAQTKEYAASGGIPFVSGFENNCDSGTGARFNWILSNEQRSQQKDQGQTYYPHLLPEGAAVSSIDIYYYTTNPRVRGFEFFDKKHTLIMKIGSIAGPKQTVVLADNEVIIGVIAKLVSGNQSLYSNFQFQIGKY